MSLRTLFLSFFFLFSIQFMPEVAAQNSLLPTVDTESDVPKDCIELSETLSSNAHAGKWLAIKLRCGRMGLEDVVYYVRYILQFVFNVIGTLGLLAIIQAGYTYIMNQKKENAEGQKAIKNAIIGIVIAFSSFTIARIMFTFFQVSS